MSEFHDNYPQYELMAHHSEEQGKLKRRKLWNVFWIMLGITIVELIIGFNAESLHLLNDDRSSKSILKVIFIGLTLAKAFYIVYKFMHLGEEKSFLKYTLILPYSIFAVYLSFLVLIEGSYCKVHKDKMDDLIVNQKEQLDKSAAQHHGHAEE